MTMCLIKQNNINSSFGLNEQTGPTYFVFCRLYPPSPSQHGSFSSYLSSLYSSLTLYRRCGLAYPYDWTEGVCTAEFLSRKPGFLLSAVHSHAFCLFSVAPLVFLFLGLLPLQLYQIWRIFCEECGWTLFVWLQKLYLTDMFEWLLSYIQL